MAKMWLALTAKNIRSRPWLQPGTLRDETSIPESRQKTLNREMSCWKREERTDLIWPLASPQKIKLWSEARETTLEVKVGRCSIFTWFTNISSSKTMANLQRNRIEAKKYCNQAKILKRPVQYFEMQWKCNHGPKFFRAWPGLDWAIGGSASPPAFSCQAWRQRFWMWNLFCYNIVFFCEINLIIK